jgi:hypothetical protein
MENLLAPARSSGPFSNLKPVTQADGTAELKTVVHAVYRARQRHAVTDLMQALRRT